MQKRGVASGKCSRCGQTFQRPIPQESVTCCCYEVCPICGQKMQPYTPDLTPSTYGKDGKHGLLIVMVCNNVVAHPDKSPFLSTQKPIEVELTS